MATRISSVEVENAPAAVTYPQVTINGYGERAGNASLDEVVIGTQHLLKLKTNIKTEKLYQLAQLAEKYIMIPIHQQKPLVGRKAFTHEAGIHVHGILRQRETYELINPETLTRKTHFLIGKHTGDAMLQTKLTQLNYKTDKETRDRIRNTIIGYLEIHKSDRVEEFELAKKNIEALTRGVTDKELTKIIQFIESVDILQSFTGE